MCVCWAVTDVCVMCCAVADVCAMFCHWCLYDVLSLMFVCCAVQVADTEPLPGRVHPSDP